tara:strand:- start:449 stop:811 length:363 start_codon:yes stop_codon:yes gene_type:complete
MSVIKHYAVHDLAERTKDLMNTLYSSEWEEEISPQANDQYLFQLINKMHHKIMLDSEIKSYPKGTSQFFDIANRLQKIETVLTGNVSVVPQQITIRHLIERTSDLIISLSSTERKFCIIS